MAERGTAPKTSSSAIHLALVGLLLLAALLRFWSLPAFPPGVAHDEVAEMMIAEGILQGHHALFFREAFGQEPLFLYLVAGARLLLGCNVLALRFVSASVGLLTVAAGARWSRRLFNRRIAVVTAAGLSVMLWPVFWSRVGLRGMLLPLTLCLGADALWAVLTRQRPYRSAVVGGVWFGLAVYTYLAARGIPILLGGFMVLLFLLDRARLRRRWKPLLVLVCVTTLLALPLTVYLLRNKEAQFRVYEVDQPLQDLKAGDPTAVLTNVGRVAGMFTIEGDATERNNYPRRPVFAEPIWSVLFYLGLGVVLIRFRDIRYSLLLVWLAAMLSPSVVTTEAPNFVRTLGALPVVMVIPAVGADFLRRLLGKIWSRSELVVMGLLVAGVAVNSALTIQTYFVRWAQIPEVGFVWQGGLKAAAAWLDERPAVNSISMGGLSTTMMDAKSLDLLMQRENVAVRWCDPGSPLGVGGGMVMPAEGGSFLLPAFVPLNPELASYPAIDDADPVDYGSFQVYDLTARGATNGTASEFQGSIALLGLTGIDGPFELGLPLALQARAGTTVTFLSVWEALEGDQPDVKAFVHLVDRGGVLQTQHDGMDCPALFWQAGDHIVQRHRLDLPADLAPGRYALRVGLYDRQTLVPYPVLDGSPYLETGYLEIHDAE